MAKGGQMDAAETIVAALRDLLAVKPYTRISVQNLCESAYLSRRTFYKHFADKTAVVSAMVYEDFIGPPLAMRKSIDLKEFKSSARLLSETTYKIIFENRLCYNNLLEYMGKMQLAEIIQEVNSSFTFSVIENYDYPPEDMEFAAFMMGSLSAAMIVRWIEQGYPESHTRLSQLYNSWVLAHWRELGFPQK
jgi:AcrR family transcriptional regulator